MKIGISATGPSLEAQVEPRFGRCPYFLIVDSTTLAFEAVENPSQASVGGAGIQSAQLMSEKGVSTVLTGNCGPNAARTFDAAGIEVVTGVSGPVRQALEQFGAGAFSPGGGANVPSHSGMQAGSGQGRGMGVGGGGGSGMGRGLGRGMGMGGRGGAGRGQGQGRAQGEGASAGSRSAASRGGAGALGADEELQQLKEQAEALQRRIDELESGGRKA